MALLTVAPIVVAGTTDTLAQAANCTVDCSNGRTFLTVLNGSGGSINVTIVTPGTDDDGNAIADRVIAVGAGVRKHLRLNPGTYSGIADVAYSATADVTHAAHTV